jgi:hypothetical protein
MLMQVAKRTGHLLNIQDQSIYKDWRDLLVFRQVAYVHFAD